MSRSSARSRCARRTRSFTLPESLESRRLFAAVHWDGGGNGSDWSDPINWNTNQVPTANDDVTINVGGSPSVYVRNGVVARARSLTTAEVMFVEGTGSRLELGAASYVRELLDRKSVV